MLSHIRQIVDYFIKNLLNHLFRGVREKLLNLPRALVRLRHLPELALDILISRKVHHIIHDVDLRLIFLLFLLLLTPPILPRPIVQHLLPTRVLTWMVHILGILLPHPLTLLLIPLRLLPLVLEVLLLL